MVDISSPREATPSLSRALVDKYIKSPAPVAPFLSRHCLRQTESYTGPTVNFLIRECMTKLSISHHITKSSLNTCLSLQFMVSSSKFENKTREDLQFIQYSSSKNLSLLCSKLSCFKSPFIEKWCLLCHWSNLKVSSSHSLIDGGNKIAARVTGIRLLSTLTSLGARSAKIYFIKNAYIRINLVGTASTSDLLLNFQRNFRNNIFVMIFVLIWILFFI